MMKRSVLWLGLVCGLLCTLLAVRAVEGGPLESAAGAQAYRPPEDPEQVLVVSEAMRDYFDAYVPQYEDTPGRARALVDAVLDLDKFAFKYQWDGVYDVQEVFRRHQGNCISFTLFLSALFEEFGIRAHINDVHLFRTRWTALGRYVAEVGHVNVSFEDHGSVYNVDFSRILGQEYTVYGSTPISRKTAIALFYSNFGVHAYTSSQSDALMWLKKAVSVQANYTSLTNLATALMHENDLVQARSLLLRAGRMQKDARYYSLLATLEEREGNTEASKEALAKAQKYIERNPYHHYNQAIQAEAKGDFEAAAKAIKRALQLKETLPFLRLQVSILSQLGRDTSRIEKRLGEMERLAMDPDWEP